MFRKIAFWALMAIGSLMAVTPVKAQSTVWRIDSEHSTARLFLASSRNVDADVNAGVARANGTVIRTGGDLANPVFDFTIYPAEKPDDTVIHFKSTRVVREDRETYRVAGDLTLTYVQRSVTYDPNESYSGPVYGPAVTHSVKQQAVFEFHKVDPSAARPVKESSAEWIASSTINGESFPELLKAMATTVWPTFVADEQCVMPSTVGEDFSGPACTGERLETAARKDLNCDMPATIGEDFASEVCTPTSTPMVVAPTRDNQQYALRHNNAEPRVLVANEVKFQLDLRLTETRSTVAAGSGN
jgi:hypothetical protein